MLRRQARERREFLYKKSKENQFNVHKYQKNPSNAISLKEKSKYNSFDYDKNCIYDEYQSTGTTDPKIMLTTSHEPSARLKMFTKELRLLFPNAQRMNRGKYELKSLMNACRANDVTDFIIVHENRGVPDGLVVCHLPYGPTAFFNISGVVMRHDIPGIGPMSEQKPHLIFHNFKSELGTRIQTILKHLFPVPNKNSNRVMTFANNNDYISVRNHTYRYVDRELELVELGPRFQLKLFQIKLGTLENIQSANTEWVYRPYMNTSSKRLFISDEKGWNENESEENDRKLN